MSNKHTTLTVGFYVAGYHGYKTLEFFKNNSPNCKVSFIITYQTKGILFNYLKEMEEIANTLNAEFFNLSLPEFQTTPARILLEGCSIIFIIGWQRMFRELLPNMVVLHDSFLPNMRGFSPTVSSLIQGKTYLGASLIKPVLHEPDAGPIYMQLQQSVHYPLKIIDAYDIVAEMYISLILYFLKKPFNKFEEKTFTRITYSMWRDGLDYFINWKWPANKIVRFIDAVSYPYLGARSSFSWYSGTLVNNMPRKFSIVIYAAEVISDNIVIEDHEDHTGKVFSLSENNEPTIVCGQGLIKLTDYVIDGKTFGDGYPIKLRTRFI